MGSHHVSGSSSSSLIVEELECITTNCADLFEAIKQSLAQSAVGKDGWCVKLQAVQSSHIH